MEQVSSLSLGFVLGRKWEAGEAELWNLLKDKCLAFAVSEAFLGPVGAAWCCAPAAQGCERGHFQTEIALLPSRWVFTRALPFPWKERGLWLPSTAGITRAVRG